jgi:Flp pilus assembly pilin Flp
MKHLLKRLWKDQRGAVTSMAVILLYTILVLGATVGLITLRDQIVQEYGDLAVALDSLNQNWLIPGDPDVGWTDDTRLFGDPPGNDDVGEPPALLEFLPPEPEGP